MLNHPFFINLLRQVFSSDLPSLIGAFARVSSLLFRHYVALRHIPLQSSFFKATEFLLKRCIPYISLLLTVLQSSPTGHRIKLSSLAHYAGFFGAISHKYSTHPAKTPGFQYSPECFGLYIQHPKALVDINLSLKTQLKHCPSCSYCYSAPALQISFLVASKRRKFSRAKRLKC